MTDMYQVVGECAHVTVDTPHGRTVTLMYRGALVPGDAPQVRHLLDAGLIAKVEPVAAPDPVTAPEPVTEPDPADPPKPAPVVEHVDPEVEAARAAARAKLPADGSAPDGRMAEAVWVEYAVVKGFDRAEAEKAGKDELRKLLGKG